MASGHRPRARAEPRRRGLLRGPVWFLVAICPRQQTVQTDTKRGVNCLGLPSPSGPYPHHTRHMKAGVRCPPQTPACAALTGP